jgi:hypothetical protein
VDIRASKVGCALRFFEEGGRGLVAGPFEAVLHLLEHYYHPALLPFWYSAAEVGWDAAGSLATSAKKRVCSRTVWYARRPTRMAAAQTQVVAR